MVAQHSYNNFLASLEGSLFGIKYGGAHFDRRPSFSHAFDEVSRGGFLKAFSGKFFCNVIVLVYTWVDMNHNGITIN